MTDIPHVIVIDDKSSMWGNIVRVFGPYPTRDAALMDKDRLSALYPRRAFIEVSPINPGHLAGIWATPAQAPKAKAAKR